MVAKLCRETDNGTNTFYALVPNTLFRTLEGFKQGWNCTTLDNCSKYGQRKMRNVLTFVVSFGNENMLCLPVLAWLIDKTCNRADAASSFTLSELDFNMCTKEVISSRDEVSSHREY